MGHVNIEKIMYSDITKGLNWNSKGREAGFFLEKVGEKL